MESRKRSLLKAFSWRGIALAITALVTFLYSGDWRAAAAIGFGDSAIKIFAYYLHERAWQSTDLGRTPDRADGGSERATAVRATESLPTRSQPETC